MADSPNLCRRRHTAVCTVASETGRPLMASMTEASSAAGTARDSTARMLKTIDVAPVLTGMRRSFVATTSRPSTPISTLVTATDVTPAPQVVPGAEYNDAAEGP